jgi:hypothetical protein
VELNLLPFAACAARLPQRCYDVVVGLREPFSCGHVAFVFAVAADVAFDLVIFILELRVQQIFCQSFCLRCSVRALAIGDKGTSCLVRRKWSERGVHWVLLLIVADYDSPACWSFSAVK